MDAYSRFIVGWHLSDSLAVEGALQALTMAHESQPHLSLQYATPA